jgi:hypothetical protein
MIFSIAGLLVSTCGVLDPGRTKINIGWLVIILFTIMAVVNIMYVLKEKVKTVLQKKFSKKVG